jgi:hypothetical protein
MATIPEMFGLAIVGAAIGAAVFGAGANGMTASVWMGGVAGALAAAVIVLALRLRSAHRDP